MDTKKQYKVILVDDHLLLRDAIGTLINSFDECSVIATAANGLELIKLIQDGNKPDIIILDIEMPVMNGNEVAKWLQDNHPDMNILVLTMFDSEFALIRLLQLGVKGFLKKDIHPSELRSAILSVAANGYHYSHITTGKLASFIQKSHINQTSIEKAFLNPKEIKFLQMASTELTYKEIAQEMQMTPRAIDGYRDTLFDKLEVKSRVGLAIYAVKHGIVTI